jgi:hypothetical protein
MDITAITPTLPPQAVVAAAPVPAGKTSIPAPSGTRSDSITIGAALSDKTGKLSLLSDGSNSIALNTKETDQKLSILADSIGKMKGALVEIKNYPPFPAESSGRQELLMSYASIRKELLQMTFPKPPPPIYEKVQHLWQELFQKGASSNTIKLPGELGSSTPDSGIKAAVADLTTLHDGITSLRSDLKQSLLSK